MSPFICDKPVKFIKRRKIFVDSDEKLKIEANVPVPFPIQTPGYVGGSVYQGRGTFGKVPKFTKDCWEVVETLKEYSHEKAIESNSEARKLIQDLSRSRIENPFLHPSFDTLSPDCFLFCDKEYSISSSMSLESNLPLLHILGNKSDYESIIKTFPVFNPIVVFDPFLNHLGVFSNSEITIREGFEVSTPNHMVVVGLINTPEYRLTLSAKKIWLLESQVKSVSIKLVSPDIVLSTRHKLYEKHNMPESLKKSAHDYFF